MQRGERIFYNKMMSGVSDFHFDYFSHSIHQRTSCDPAWWLKSDMKSRRLSRSMRKSFFPENNQNRVTTSRGGLIKFLHFMPLPANFISSRVKWEKGGEHEAHQSYCVTWYLFYFDFYHLPNWKCACRDTSWAISHKWRSWRSFLQHF